MNDDMKRKQRESEKQLRVTHKHSERVFPKPNKTPQLQRIEPKGKEGLVMMARKGDLKELSARTIFFPLTTYPLLYLVLFFMCYRIMKMCF